MREPLQNIQLIRDSLALYAKFFAPFTLLAIVPLALQVFVSRTLFSDLLTVDLSQMEAEEVIAYLTDALPQLVADAQIMFLVSLVLSAITSAMISLAVVDSRQGRPFNLPFYIMRGLSRLPLIVLFKFVVLIMSFFAAFLFLLPGLYLTAAFWVLTPLLVIERRGVDALGRCWTLTQGYRWHILGLMLAAALTIILTEVLVQIILIGPLIIGGTNLWASAVVEILISAPLTAILFILVAQTYLRLCEIKEGVTAEEITTNQ